MNPYTIPPRQLDSAAVPPALHTGEVGSFAQYTMAVRVPAILRETIALNRFPADIVAALEALHAELVNGSIRPLQEAAADRDFWNQVSAAHFGRSWLDVPWYWAEAYFYRRVLEATRYFQPGPWHGFDPFTAKKQLEWAPDAAPRTVDLLLSDLPADPALRFERLFHASLWGNRTDLSYMVAAHLGGTTDAHGQRANLLADDTAQVWAFLRSRRPQRIIVIADNAGTELTMDLALADFLLAENLARQVCFHLKPQPFYVSDAMPQDALAGIAALATGGQYAQALGQRLASHLASDRLRFTAHWLYATSLFYSQLPDDLRNELAAADLVLVKGDANYRRLLDDAHWPTTTPFAATVAYFPASLVALRTLKSELIIGLPAGTAEKLAAEDPAWLVNGKRGVI